MLDCADSTLLRGRLSQHGAQGGTRTLTRSRELEPKSSLSTSSNTWALNYHITLVSCNINMLRVTMGYKIVYFAYESVQFTWEI